MQKYLAVGNLTNKPLLHYTNSNKAYCKFNIAVNGLKKDDVSFINCIVWEKLAENLCQYQDKGNKIAIEGRLQSGMYEKDGKKTYTLDVIVSNIEFLSNKHSDEVTPNDFEKEETNPFVEMQAKIDNEQINLDSDFLE